MTRKKKAKAAESRTRNERSRSQSFHAFWSGSLSFGLVNVPVLVFPATRHSGIRFRLLSPQGSPLKRRFYCPTDNKQLAPNEIVRGYELDDNSYIIVEDRELEAIEPQKTREIALLEFVDLAELPPHLLERGYYLTPQKDASRAYCLLAETMERTNRAGIATFVMRDREYLVAIFAENGILCAETLRFDDELRDPKALGLAKGTPARRQRVAAFERAIESLSTRSIASDDLTDVDTRKLRAIIARKLRAGKDLVHTARGTNDVDADDVEDVDLVETIRKSLHQAQNKPPRRRKPIESSRNWASRKGAPERPAKVLKQVSSRRKGRVLP
jgi:DNA end-binding protein Ku